jgi:hypothetical protein
LLEAIKKDKVEEFQAYLISLKNELKECIENGKPVPAESANLGKFC